MRLPWIAVAMAMPLVISAGCGKVAGPSSAAPTKSSSPKVPVEVTLTEGTVADLDRAVKEVDKAVVLVEFWSLATEPSPDLSLAANTRGGDQQARGASLGKDKVAWHGMRKAEYLAHKYEGYFLRVISVNVDGPGKKDEVLKYLKTHDAKYVTNNLWKDTPTAASAQYGFKGTVPHQVVFARNGNKVWTTGDPLPGTLDDFLFHELDK
jgi:hypothetical protein